jgi:hypothetical protein
VNTKVLKQYLSHYNDTTCPDYLYLAFRVLILGEDRPDRPLVISTALKDLAESEKTATVEKFNVSRRHMEGLELRKYNW